MAYLSNELFRTLGQGVDLTDIEEFELAAIIERASSVVDAACAVPRAPSRHSFLGGSATAEQHPWRTPETFFEAGTRRIYPVHWPILTVSDFKVKVTNYQYVTIQPTEVFVNNTDRYLEIVSLAFTGVGLFGMILPTISLMRPVAEVSYTYGWRFAAVGERLYPTDARTYRARNQFWFNDSPSTTTIYKNGTAVTTGVTVNRAEGTAVFDAQLAATDVVTADYQYPLPAEIRDATSMVTTYLIGERQIAARGMTGLSRIAVGEVSLSRQPTSQVDADEIVANAGASSLLDGYRFTRMAAGV
jgi:hypothetical protein